MADLIERTEALRIIGEFDDRGLALWQVQRITDGCKEAVAALPAVDAVPVVRCKDCKHAIIQGSFGPGTVLCRENDTIYPLNGFCSKGTKEGGEENDD